MQARGSIDPVAAYTRAWELAKERWFEVIVVVVLSQLLAVIPIVLNAPLMAGVVVVSLRLMRGQAWGIETLFDGFKHFTASFIAMLLFFIGIVGVVAVLGGGLAGGAVFLQRSFGDAAVALVGLIGLPLALLASVVGMGFQAFALPLIVDRGTPPVEALQAGVSAALSNIGPLLLFVLLTMLVSIAGLLACGVGLLVAMPVTQIAMVVLYEQVFGLAEAG